MLESACRTSIGSVEQRIRSSTRGAGKRAEDVSLSDDLKTFIAEHRVHGQLTGDAAEPGLAGYQVWIACPVALRSAVR